MPRRRRGGNGGQGPATANPVEEGKKVRSDDVRKTFLKYKCTNENCGKTWNSFHGWKSTLQKYQEHCQNCRFGIGKLTDMKEEMAMIDCYLCFGCNGMWSCLHPQDGQQQRPQQATCGKGCYLACAEMIGTQIRHCKIISFKCNKPKCASEWNSPYFEKEYSQRCRKCNGKGAVFGHGVSSDDEKRGGDGMVRRHGGGGHNVEGCDMCHELKPRGLTCTSANRVVVEEYLTPDGRLTPYVLRVIYGRGYRGT